MYGVSVYACVTTGEHACVTVGGHACVNVGRHVYVCMCGVSCVTVGGHAYVWGILCHYGWACICDCG